MSVVYISSSKVQAIADAIREKTGTTDGLTLSEMPTAIANIESGMDPSELALAVVNKQIPECVSDEITSIPDYAFYKYSSLKKLRIPNAQTVGTSSFDQCNGIDQIDLPNCTKISNRSFASCNKASFINVPLLEEVPAGAFYGSQTATTANIPLVKKLASQAFYYSRTIERLDFQQLTLIEQLALNQTNLTVLIIRTNSVCSLGNANALANSPIAKGTGYVYVPRSLVDSYKAATNWATYAAQIRAIEDYPEITGG